jgi:hypothetical protein
MGLQLLRLLAVMHVSPALAEINGRMFLEGRVNHITLKAMSSICGILYSFSQISPKPLNHFVFGCGFMVTMLCAILTITSLLALPEHRTCSTSASVSLACQMAGMHLTHPLIMIAGRVGMLTPETEVLLNLILEVAVTIVHISTHILRISGDPALDESSSALLKSEVGFLAHAQRFWTALSCCC